MADLYSTATLPAIMARPRTEVDRKRTWQPFQLIIGSPIPEGIPMPVVQPFDMAFNAPLVRRRNR